MKSLIRRLMGMLVALAVLFTSAVTPAAYEPNLAVAESGTIEELAEENAAGTINFVNLKRIYDLFQERANGDLNADPASILGEEWTSLTDTEKELLPILISGEKEFIKDENGEIIGVQDRTYDQQLPSAAGNGQGNSNDELQLSSAVNPDIPEGNNEAGSNQGNDLPVIPEIKDPVPQSEDEDTDGEDEDENENSSPAVIIPVNPLEDVIDDDDNGDEGAVIIPKIVEPVLLDENKMSDDEDNDDNDDNDDEILVAGEKQEITTLKNDILSDIPGQEVEENGQKVIPTVPVIELNGSEAGGEQGSLTQSGSEQGEQNGENEELISNGIVNQNHQTDDDDDDDNDGNESNDDVEITKNKETGNDTDDEDDKDGGDEDADDVENNDDVNDGENDEETLDEEDDEDEILDEENNEEDVENGEENDEDGVEEEDGEENGKSGGKGKETVVEEIDLDSVESDEALEEKKEELNALGASKSLKQVMMVPVKKNLLGDPAPSTEDPPKQLRVSAPDNLMYTGEEKSVSVTDGDTTVDSNAYTLAIKKGDQTVTEIKDAGAYTVKATPNAGYTSTYTESNEIYFTITQADIGNFEAKFSGGPYTYTGADQAETIENGISDSTLTLSTESTTLTLGTDYQVDGLSQSESGQTGVEVKNAGTYYIILSGKGNYKGTKAVRFAVAKASIAITITSGNSQYDGDEHEATVTVTGNGAGIVQANTDYTVRYKKSNDTGSEYELEKVKEVGIYTAQWALTENGQRNFSAGDSASGTVENAYIITAKQFTFDIDNENRTKNYCGADWLSALYGYLKVTDGEYTLQRETDYEVKINGESPSSIVNYGTYAVTVTGKGGYEGYTPEAINFNVTKAQISDVSLSYNTAEYNRGNWYEQIGIAGGGTAANQLTITAKVNKPDGTEHEIKLTNTEAKLSEAVEMINASDTAYTFKWQLTDAGAVNFEIPEGKDTVSFTVTKAKIDEVKLTYATAEYNRTDWYQQIGILTPKEGVTYPNTLTIKANAAKPTGEGTEPLTMEAGEVQLGDAVKMINASDTAYTFEWKLTATGAVNFEIPEGKETVSFKIDKAKIKEEAVFDSSTQEGTKTNGYDSAPYDRKDWSKKMSVGRETKYDGNNHLIISAVAKMPLDSEGKSQEETLILIENEAVIKTEGIVEAGSYDVEWYLTDDGKTNFQIDPAVTQETKFTVNPATIVSAELTYNHTYYNRNDWADQIKTYDISREELINIITVKTEDTDPSDSSDTIDLTLNDNKTVDSGWSESKPEYEFDQTASGEMIDANPMTESGIGSYSVIWKLTEHGAKNFQLKSEKLLIKNLTVHKAEILSVTISEDGNDEDAGHKVYTDYDHEDWVKRTGINDAEVKSPHHYFIITAKTKAQTVSSDIKELVAPPKIDDFILNGPGEAQEISLDFHNSSGASVTEIINAGTYPIWVVLNDTSNFKYLEESINEADGMSGVIDESADPQYVALGLNVIERYPVIPLKNETTSVTVLSADSVVSYADVYRFGPNQNQSARTMDVSGEPGELINVTVGNETITGRISGTRFSNYDLTPAQYTGTMNLNISSGGVLTAEGGEGSISLAHNTDLTIVLAYADASNLEDRGAEGRNPASIEIPIHFDSQNPQIEDSIASFLNRDMEVTFHVPEAGRLEYIQFSETVKVNTEEFFDVRDYSAFNVTRPVEWNSGSNPQLIHSGAGALSMEYTDLVCNVTQTNFDIGQSTGAPIEILVEPIRIAGSQERIDMSERPQQIRITITGTGWELIHTDLTADGRGLTRNSDTTTASGTWAQASTGEYSFIVDTNVFPDDKDILTAAKYDDLIGSTEYTFYYDDKADGLIITMPVITEDNWVIPGIAEPGSSVEVYVDGEKVSNRKRDGFTVFAARKAQLEEGSTVRIVATDLSGNQIDKTMTVEKSPASGKLTLDAYAMGTTHTTAHTNRDFPEWLMAGLYTEEELLRGVTVPLVASCAFHIGEVDLRLANGKIESVFHPAEGVDLAGQKVTILRTQTKGFSMEEFREAGDSVAEAERAFYGYWVSAYVEANIPVEMLHNSFQLDEEQKAIRDFYFNRQRKYPMPED